MILKNQFLLTNNERQKYENYDKVTESPKEFLFPCHFKSSLQKLLHDKI